MTILIIVFFKEFVYFIYVVDITANIISKFSFFRNTDKFFSVKFRRIIKVNYFDK